MGVNAPIEGSNPSFSAHRRLRRRVRFTGETRFPPCAPFLRASGSPSVAAPRGSAVSRGGTGSGRATMPRRTRRGGRAVECGGLENRYPSLGGSRVQIPPPPLGRSRPASVEVASTAYRGTVRLGAPRVLGYARRFLRTSCLFLRTYW